MSSGPGPRVAAWRVPILLGVVAVATFVAIRVVAPRSTDGVAAPTTIPTAAGLPSPSGNGAGAGASTTTQPVPEELGSLSLAGRVDSTPAWVSGPTGAYAYDVEVVDADGRLRVSVDLSNRDDCVELRLTDPNGVAMASPSYDYPFVCPSSGRSGQSFDIEQSVAGAAPGRWRIDVIGADVRDLALRVRATLDAMPSGEPASPGQALAPDLVPWLPWEFGFSAPASVDPGTAHDRDNQPGDPSISCHPEEEPEADRCLRFSAGVDNKGDGPMTVVFQGDQAVQRTYTMDATPLDFSDNDAGGAFVEGAAGAGEWHPFHEHRHLAEFVLYELFAVTDATGALAPLDTGAKHGYCTFSQQIADWGSVAQDPQYASFPDGVFCQDAMTLERGWGDIYRWQRPGQYVSYASAADPDGSMTAGRYVVRFTVDPEDHIAEGDETNNTGYALIEVVDGGGPGADTVIVCEQGLGRDPWDPDADIDPDRFAWAKLAADPGYVPLGCD